MIIILIVLAQSVVTRAMPLSIVAALRFCPLVGVLLVLLLLMVFCSSPWSVREVSTTAEGPVVVVKYSAKEVRINSASDNRPRVAKLWPIQFGIPEEIIRSHPPHTRSQAFGRVIPGNKSTYKFFGEKMYFDEYSSSFYGLSMKKHGWDCYRHAEILAANSVPYILNLDRIPPFTMYFYPRRLMTSLMHLDGVRVDYVTPEAKVCCDVVKSATIDWKVFDLERYLLLQAMLRKYVLEYMTTSALARYMLHVTGQETAKRILCIADIHHPSKSTQKADGMSMSVQHGLKMLLGSAVVIDPEPLYMYTDYPQRAPLPKTGGHLYFRRLDPKLRSSPSKESYKRRIARREFDLIIYHTAAWNDWSLNSKVHWRGGVEQQPFYRGTRLWFVDGADSAAAAGEYLGKDPHPKPRTLLMIKPFVLKNATVFVREL